MTKIAARYTGEPTLVLSQAGGPYKDGDGKPRTSLLLYQGEILQVEEEEVTGATWLHDPRHELDSRRLGLGHIVLPEDVGLSEQELMAKGYEFHLPSGLWERVESVQPKVTQKQVATKKDGE